MALALASSDTSKVTGTVSFGAIEVLLNFAKRSIAPPVWSWAAVPVKIVLEPDLIVTFILLHRSVALPLIELPATAD